MLKKLKALYIPLMILTLQVSACGGDPYTSDVYATADSIRNRNLIHGCKELGLGPVTHCKFQNSSVFAKQPFEAKFEIDYSFTCTGLPVSIGFEYVTKRDERVKYLVPFNNGVNKKASFFGTGPVKALAFDPRDLARTYFKSGCKFVIHGFAFEPSEDIFKMLESLKAQHQDVLSAKNLAAKVIELQAGLTLLGSAIDTIDQDLTKHQQISSELKSAFSNNGIFTKIIAGSQGIVSLKDKASLIKLKTIVQQLPLENQSTQANSTVLSQHLSSDDLISIQRVITINQEDSAETQKELERVTLREIELSHDIAYIETLIAKNEENPNEDA